MKTTRIVLLVLSFLSAIPCLKAQQAFTYTQYMDNGIPYNPAYSLLDKAANINLMGRKQWVGIEGAPATFQFSGSIPLTKMNASTGLLIMHDKFAIEQLTEVNAFIGKSVQLANNQFLAVSFNAGFRSYKAGYSELDAYDPEFRDNIRETVGNIGAGLLFYTPEKFYLGASLPRLTLRNMGNASQQENRYLKNNYYLMGGALLPLGTDMKLKPAFLLSYTSNIRAQLDVSSTLYLKDQIGIGASYRNSQDVAGILSYNFNNSVRVGYSYQLGVGQERVGTDYNATHEITLGYRFGKGLMPKLL